MNEPIELDNLLTEREKRASLAVGWLSHIMDAIDKLGCKGLALVHVTEDESVAFNWVDLTEGQVSAELIAGVAVLQSRITNQ